MQHYLLLSIVIFYALIAVPAKKIWRGNEVLPKSSFSSTLRIGQKNCLKLSDEDKLRPKIMVFSKKKGFHLNLVHYFLQLIIVAALKS